MHVVKIAQEMSDAFPFLLFVALQLVDYELTTGIVTRGGRELNPVVRRLADRLGAWALRLSKLAAIAVGYVLLLYGLGELLAAGCLLYIAVCAWNWRRLRQLRQPR